MIKRALQDVDSVWGSGVISWLSRMKTSVPLSITKAEYIATCSSCSEVVWLQKILAGLFNTEMDAIDIYYDNQSCIKLTQNSKFHDKSKNIERNYHYMWDMVQRGDVKLYYVPTWEQVVDVLAKPLYLVSFEHFRDKLGVI